ncbi:MAG TPA: acyloxyacyl hydrolase [Micavibrio sp.]|nr:acyloxyacyl hydrolase [Micavibrio sp.]
MGKYALLAAFCGLLSAFAAPANAQDSVLRRDYLSLGVGYYDIMDDADSVDLRVEYRPGQELFWMIKPWAGLEVNADGSVWGGGGILADFHATKNIVITPSFGVGLYNDGGSEKDLGHPVEFRTQLEIAYEFDNGHRLGTAFSHTSNAHLGSKNPGTETLTVYYSIPFDFGF